MVAALRILSFSTVTLGLEQSAQVAHPDPVPFQLSVLHYLSLSVNTTVKESELTFSTKSGNQALELSLLGMQLDTVEPTMSKAVGNVQ